MPIRVNTLGIPDRSGRILAPEPPAIAHPAWTGRAWVSDAARYQPPPPPVPVSITRLQARLALLEAGLWDAVMAWASTADARSQAYFEDAQTWYRDDPILNAAAPALGLSASALDELFRRAAR